AVLELQLPAPRVRAGFGVIGAEESRGEAEKQDDRDDQREQNGGTHGCGTPWWPPRADPMGASRARATRSNDKQRETTTNNEKRCLRGRRGYSEYPWGACQIFPADATCGDTMPLMPLPPPRRDCKPASPPALSGDRKFTPACN